MAVADRHSLPIAVSTESATPLEAKLVMQTLVEIFVEEPVQRLIGEITASTRRTTNGG